MDRLDKWLATGQYSRKEAKKLIKDKAVIVNGKFITDPAYKIDENKDKICVYGVPFLLKKYIYIMLNKPKGVVSASLSPNDTTVVDILPKELKRDGLFPAGRLDKDTTGFVLITNDGAFAHNILSPKHHVEKTYIVTTKNVVDKNGIIKLKEGILLKDGTKFLPADVKILSGHHYEIKICEGKYHQIKRMFASIGAPVVELNRIQIGGLVLDSNLKLGEAKELNIDELKKITK